MSPRSARGLPLVLLAGLVTGLRAQTPQDTTDLPPAGFGTLHQEEVSTRLSAGSIQVRVLPLNERIIRLLAPDTYAAMHQLRTTHAAEIERLALQHGLRRADLWLVTFFGLAPRAQFNPEDITITSQNRLFRPAALLPLSAQWSELQLSQRETASAIYLFEEGIALLEPLTVAYGGVSTGQWEQALRNLERERARAFSRATTPPARH